MKPQDYTSLIEKLREMGFNIHDFTKPIYKYVTVEAAKSILSNSSVWFRPPFTFNDPFELSMDALDFTCSETEYRQNITKALLTLDSNISLSELHKTTRNYTKERYTQDFRNAFEKERNNSFLFCTSEINDQTLMWSHYAEHHKGFCIGLSCPSFTEKLLTLRVNYIDTITPRRILSLKEDDFSDAVNYWIHTKAKAWEYEREVRTTIASKDRNDMKIDKDGLPYVNVNLMREQVVEVYAGVKTSKQDIDAIQSIIKERNYPLAKFGKMQMKKNFQLEIVDI